MKMKTKSIIAAAFSICLISGSAFAQERTVVKKEVKEVKSVSKEIRMEEENGVKTLTISTDDNGIKTTEVFTGEDADRKMAEMEPEESTTVEERIEVQIDEDVNDRRVTIRKTSNGMETIEVYEGEEADEKIKELESGAGPELEGEEKVIIKKEVERSQKKSSKQKDIKG